MKSTRVVRLGAVWTVLLWAGLANAAPIGIGFTVSYIEVAGPGVVGDVAIADGAVFVGVGNQGTAFPPTCMLEK